MSKQSFKSLGGLVFRVTERGNQNLQKTAEASKQAPGRFNTGTTGAIYVSREPDTAIDELRRQAEEENKTLVDMHPQSILVLNVSLTAMIDLCDGAIRKSWGLTANDLQDDDESRCQVVAAQLIEGGAEAVKWISATGEGQSMAIYLEKLLPNSSLEIVQTIELEKSLLEDIERGVDVTDRLPELRDFPLVY